MNGVIGMVDLLMETELKEEQLEYTEIIRKSADALVTVINDILDFTKMESGKMEMEEHPFELQNCIKEVFSLFSMEAGKKDLELVYFIDEAIPPIIYGDMARLRQVLINLISNALKFTHQGGVYLMVSLRERAEDGSLMIEFAVKDTGIGITPDKQNRLFQPFSQLDSSMTRKYGGTGLGLAICKSLVEMMGGSIYVESTEEKGATFIFTIRTSEPESDDGMMGMGDDLLVSLPSAKDEEPLILVVDDHPVNQKLMVSMLGKLGLRAEVAEDGRQAVDKIRANPVYRLIFMDLQMPVMDGLEATALIREMQPPGYRPVIIAMTANVMEGIRSRCREAGMDDYISKPVNMKSVKEILMKHPVPAQSKGLQTSDANSM
ncbi:hypothetical protein BGX30_001678 [Mortierella sp. GBA39]|nr:hypothetical protein BGX30_001678 [Mortierella sp. GBA39]